jgi:hypothetical protein
MTFLMESGNVTIVNFPGSHLESIEISPQPHSTEGKLIILGHLDLQYTSFS